MRHCSNKKFTSLFITSLSLTLVGLSAQGSIAKRLIHKKKTAVHVPTHLTRALLASKIRNWGVINTNKDHSAIDAFDAWKITSGSKKVVVAVIDTGLDAHHRDLARNVWHDPHDKTHKTWGWNFVTNKPNPYDDHGHGTHVSGIIGAVADLKTGVAGVAQHVSIMPVKYYSDANPGSVNLANTIKAINWAVDHGANIINYSGGGPEFSEGEYLAIKKAEAKGVLFVAAAGNEHSDTDLTENYYYPSAYRLPNIISVAAIDINNHLIPSSNWGPKKVDVAAPGKDIFSTLPGNRYGTMTGTSQATAFVTGLAALLLSKDPTLTPPQIRKLILGSVDHEPGLKGKLISGGKVNAYRALLALSGDFNKSGTAKPSLVASRPTSLIHLFTPLSESN